MSEFILGLNFIPRIVLLVVVFNSSALWAQGHVSVSSCMATACHGSRDKSTPAWQQAGALWFDHDPHARAYTSLLSKKSQQIVRSLTQREHSPKSEQYVQFLEKYCVSCHASDSHPISQRNLGADCQVCHGSLTAFDERHYSEAWKSLGAKRFSASQCVDVESTLSRANVCSSCHIGQFHRSGHDRVVDHQIMAAGHPPMHFDVQVFMNTYPKHWKEKNRSDSTSENEYERWRTNRIVMAKARLDLLRDRAEQISNRTHPPGALLSDWPEFTEYSCSSCHHELTHRDWGSVSHGPSLGRFDDWYLPYLDIAFSGEQRVRWKELIFELRASMEQISPNATTVQQKAGAVSDFLEQRQSPFEPGLAKHQLAERLVDLCSIAPRSMSFESAVQWVSATDAIMKTLELEHNESDDALRSMFPFLDNKRETWRPNQPSLYSRAEQYSIEPIVRRRDYLINQLKPRP